MRPTSPAIPRSTPGQKIGIAALEEIDEISILCCPDEYLLGPLQRARSERNLIAQCENLKYRFAITPGATESCPTLA